ncbi:hypothetical protein UAJ10_07185 [Nitrospirillum sp. BR 11164]|uniref:hypothetical protein n=1 Tax=Nitrospirillum sp. BR 11164 TaxID=3104324 RepID=UPI002AFE01B9|nr:hypothetical protein [Nitrospirillum sp. BR 11164]MEA1648798.1 hypothetical protein [Nitrospirillum sp. BR 11164]
MGSEAQADVEMALLVIDTVTVEIPIQRTVAEAVARQVNAGIPLIVQDGGQVLSEVLLAALVRDFKPPSRAQLRFARAIAQRLGLMMSLEVFNSHDACSRFISQHVDTYRRLTVSGRGVKPR